MKSWYLYILECADNTLYTGITLDPERRLAEHNNGTGAKYTRARLPVAMVYCIPAGNRSEASRMEYRTKRLTRIKKRQLIETRSNEQGK